MNICIHQECQWGKPEEQNEEIVLCVMHSEILNWLSVGMRKEN